MQIAHPLDHRLHPLVHSPPPGPKRLAEAERVPAELIWCVSFCRGEGMQIQMEFVDLVLRVHACLQSVPCLVGSLELACVCPV